MTHNRRNLHNHPTLKKDEFLPKNMEKATIYLFTSPTCPHCPAAKAQAEQLAKEREDIELKTIISGMPGEELFKEYDVTSVPTFIIKGAGFPNNIGLRGSQNIKTLSKYVDKALGKEPQEQQKDKQEKKGLFKKIFKN